MKLWSAQAAQAPGTVMGDGGPEGKGVFPGSHVPKQ